MLILCLVILSKELQRILNHVRWREVDNAGDACLYNFKEKYVYTNMNAVCIAAVSCKVYGQLIRRVMPMLCEYLLSHAHAFPTSLMYEPAYLCKRKSGKQGWYNGIGRSFFFFN
eukprot:TRINITY_DN19257_c0_g1_i1.p1 TRINITY_DN19257_c0_g1~~TRINITY_DN19257_c0_g1_i1.p1  ORF type:complete len:114 (-),score=2.34 TRINITY_DN19257_c0_g1_i1:87-428(-)